MTGRRKEGKGRRKERRKIGKGKKNKKVSKDGRKVKGRRRGI